MNFRGLSSDMGRPFADMFGCSDASVKAVFVKLSQDRHGDLFGSAESKVVVQRYIDVVRANTDLSAQCTRV